MIKEIWVFYKETNNARWGHRIYYVSNWGRVKCNGELYKCTITRGYYYLNGIPLHRIIAEKFLPDWDPNKEVDHINTIKTQNMVWNLRMVDSKGNANNPLTRQHKKGKGGHKHTEEEKLHQSLMIKGKTPWNKGIALSEEHKRKVSESLKGKIPWNKGKHHSEETKKKMSESHKKRGLN